MTPAAKRRADAAPRDAAPISASARVEAPSNAARSLLGLQGVSRDRVVSLLRRTAALHKAGDALPQPLRGKTVATLFFEDSTRTKTSFTLAARRLGAEVADLSMGSSSVNKGETLIDTARTIEAMGVHAMIVRAKQSGAAHLIAAHVNAPVINAGDGRHEHPTQGLLDAYTIALAHDRHDFNLSGLTIAIVGDVASSRVARSNIACLHALGATTICVGPPGMAPKSLELLGTRVSSDLDKVLSVADVVMMLRIQFERHGEGAPANGAGSSSAAPKTIASVREYREFYGMTDERAARLRKSAIVLHPGPMNRGIEIDASVADSPRSHILQQVSHGVLVRMAVLEAAVS